MRAHIPTHGNELRVCLYGRIGTISSVLLRPLDGLLQLPGYREGEQPIYTLHLDIGNENSVVSSIEHLHGRVTCIIIAHPPEHGGALRHDLLLDEGRGQRTSGRDPAEIQALICASR